jgi:hypothetical protein
MGDQPDIPEINEETVETLVENVREMLKDEDAREQGFNVRAGGLAGFLGLTVSAAIAVAKVGLDTPLSGVAIVCAAISLAVTFGALLTSLTLAVVKVLLPQESAAIAMSTIEKYPNWEYIVQQKVMVQGEILHGLIAALAKDRERNSSKATWLRRAYVALLVGIASMIVFAAILAIEAL